MSTKRQSPKFSGSRDPKRSPSAKQKTLVLKAARAAKQRGA